jgi:hypothetical protein
VIKSAALFLLVSFWSLGVCCSQDHRPNYTLEKGKFFADFGLDLLGRNFKSETFLGDTYQVELGYRISFDIGLAGYPGLGWSVGSQGAKVLNNQFLGGFFNKAQLGDAGIYVFHAIPFGNRFVFRPELGVGNFRVVHGVSPARFILNYTHFFGKLGFEYPIAKVSENFTLNLALGAAYSLYSGRGIVINPEDRTYIQQSRGLHVTGGIVVKIF